MTGTDIRKFLTIIENQTLESDRSILLENMDEGLKTWYMNASNIMIARIKAGEYPIDVINELAREYSWSHGGNYESFSFARDALDRRAWEMGLRYTDEAPARSHEQTQSFHDTLITPQVTEEVKDPVTEEDLDEASIYDRILKAMAPEYAASRKFKANQAEFEGKVEKTIERLRKGFTQVSKGGKEKTLNVIKSAFEKSDIHPKFIDSVFAEIAQKYGDIEPDEQLDYRKVEEILTAMAIEAESKGGLDKLKKSNYDPDTRADLDNSATDGKGQEDGEENSQIPTKPSKLRTVASMKAAIAKAVKDPSSLSPDEVKDMAILMNKFGIPTVSKLINK